MRLQALLISLLVPRFVASPLPKGLITSLPRRAPTVIEPPETPANHWVDSWATMPLSGTQPQDLAPYPFNTTGTTFADTTVRQTVRLTLGGELLRIRISNVFGVTDLPITGVSIAFPAGGVSGASQIQAGTSQRVTFSGEKSVVVPRAALAVSDPIQFDSPLDATTVLTVNIYSKEGQEAESVTWHPESWTTSWLSRGDRLDDAELPTGDSSTIGVAHWYWLVAVEVWSAKTTSTVVVVGDSITDGVGSTVNGNNRWPDLLLNRLLESGIQPFSVINQAAGGNRILSEGGGPNALSRIDRDVLAHSGVTHAIIFEGVNDIGSAPTDVGVQAALAKRLIWSYRQIIERLHSRNIVVIGATISPFGGPGQGYSHPNRETTRKTVNEWIGTSGAFDAVVDFSGILADPEKQDQLSGEYDTGDHLHPNVAGFQAVAASFPLDVFQLRR